jgi:hypothetical protein
MDRSLFRRTLRSSAILATAVGTRSISLRRASTRQKEAQTESLRLFGFTLPKFPHAACGTALATFERSVTTAIANPITTYPLISPNMYDTV